MNWIKHPIKRFTTHLAFISLSLLISLNVFGNTYLLITQQGFFTFQEAAIINVVSLAVAVLMTFINWATHFYFRWIKAETIASQNALLIKNLRQIIAQPVQTIQLQKGTSTFQIELRNILTAKIEFGIVRVFCNNGESGFFQDTLSHLNTLLPAHLFFQVTRDAILHREFIKSISSSSYGKIGLVTHETNGHSSTYTVSRPKAAAFRKWFNSNSG